MPRIRVNREKRPNVSPAEHDIGIKSVEVGADPPTERKFTSAEPTGMARLHELMEHAKQGYEYALPKLNALLDDHPEVWAHYGDLAAHTRHSWIELASGRDPAMAEMLTRKVEALQANLMGPFPGTIERLLAERVVATWLQINCADAVVARATEMSVQDAELATRRQAAAERSHLAALAALATFRKLLPMENRTGGVADADDHPRAAGPTHGGPERVDQPVAAGGVRAAAMVEIVTMERSGEAEPDVRTARRQR